MRGSADRGQQPLALCSNPLSCLRELFRRQGLAQLCFILGWERGMQDLRIVGLHQSDVAAVAYARQAALRQL
jgi:hypothetical protein